MNKKRQQGRRRRGKKDVILDFSKGVKRKRPSKEGESDDESGQIAAIVKPKMTKANTVQASDGTANIASDEARQKRKKDDRLSLRTSSQDYGSNLGLPDKIEQREFETTAQFFRRLDRLVAKARVEANLEARFDMTIPKGQKSSVNHDSKTASANKGVAMEKVDNSQKQSSLGSKLRHNKRKKRLKR